MDNAAIEAILRDEDIEGLIGLGAPADEYDAEAREIRQNLISLGANATEENLAEAIRRIWDRQFGPLEAPQLNLRNAAFFRIAQRILSEP